MVTVTDKSKDNYDDPKGQIFITADTAGAIP
jgi:hypothetical protein